MMVVWQDIMLNSSYNECVVCEMQGTKVNMIMTDYCMPGMSGYDLLKRLKVHLFSPHFL